MSQESLPTYLSKLPTKSFIVQRELPFSLYWILAAMPGKSKVNMLAIAGILVNFLYGEERAKLERFDEPIPFYFQVDDYSSLQSAVAAVDLLIESAWTELSREAIANLDVLHMASGILYCSTNCLLKDYPYAYTEDMRYVTQKEYDTKHDENVESGNHWGALCPTCEKEYHNYG